MTKAAIYARYSSEMQRDGNSIEGQVNDCKKYALNNNLEIVKIFTDEAKSGKNVLREGFNAMLDSARKKEFEALIVYDMSRFSRSTVDYRQFKDIIVNDLGIRFISVCEKIDETPEGFLLENIKATLNEYYLRDLKVKVMRGQKVNAFKAKFNGGYAPLGYGIDKENNYFINEEERPIVVLIFNEYAKGQTYTAIIKNLNDHGYKTRFGREFGKNSIYEILKNKKYIGIYEFNKAPARSKEGTRNNHKRKTQEDIISIENVIPAIIDKNLFNTVQTKLAGREHHNTLSKENYMLTGIAFCGHCKRKLNGNKRTVNGKAYPAYECSGRVKKDCILKFVPRDVIEGEVVKYLKSIYTDEAQSKIYDYVTKQLSNIKKDTADKIGLLKNEISKREQKLQNCLKAIESGLFSETLKTRISELEREINIFEDEIQEQLLRKDVQKKFTPDIITEELKEIKELDNSSREEQACIIKKYIKRVDVLSLDENWKFVISTNLDKFVGENGAEGGT